MICSVELADATFYQTVERNYVLSASVRNKYGILFDALDLDGKVSGDQLSIMFNQFRNLVDTL